MKRNYYTFALLMVILSSSACAFRPSIPVPSPKCEQVNAMFTEAFLRHNVDSWLPMIETAKVREWTP